MEDERIKCPICYSGNCEKIVHYFEGGEYRIICSRCGKFITNDIFIAMSSPPISEKQRSIISSVLRELSETTKKPPSIYSTNYKEYLTHYLIPDLNNPEAKAMKLILRLKEKSNYFGENISFFLDDDYPLAYAQNSREGHAIYKFLEENELIKHWTSNSLELTSEGWKIANDIIGTIKNSNQAFIAIWFDESMKQNQQTIIDVVRESGYQPMCIANEHFSEKIIDKALNEIKKSKFVIVDLTGSRNSVFFEAGFAFGLGLEVIFIYDKNDNSKDSLREFYVKHYQCYSYINKSELKEILINAIGARIN